MQMRVIAVSLANHGLWPSNIQRELMSAPRSSVLHLVIIRLLPCLLGSVSAQSHADAPAATARLGINLARPSDSATELPFVDVFRTARPWISQRRGASWAQGPELAVDALGWVESLQPDCYAEAMLCTIPDGHFPAGIYTVFYEGEGQLAFSKSVKVRESQPGRILIDVDSSKRGFSLRIEETNPTTPIRNIHVIMPGFAETWEKEPFHPAFLKRWEGMACFRFMDWMDTNHSEVRSWGDRPTLAHATFSRRGVALEWMIELCNATGVDPWFCMPHLADDEFIHNFAVMTKQRLDPSRRVYIEYSNELWNGQFAQSKYAQDQGLKLGLGRPGRRYEAGRKFTALRSMQIFEIWGHAFGGNERLVRVLPSHSGNKGVSEDILGFREAANHADALAVAPYMPFTVGRGRLKDSGARFDDLSVDQLLDYFEETALQTGLERMDRDKAVADKHGLKLIAYEGGQHMVAFGRDRDLVARLTAKMQDANRHPRMGDIYRRYFDHWAAIGGGTLAVFLSIKRWNKSGAWGVAEFYDSKPSEYPKYDAVLDWAKRNGQPTGRK
ncbi:MAG: hypothetical protein ACI91B_000538 [Planctomycetota bacterium]|jgi:hypothetical protein